MNMTLAQIAALTQAELKGQSDFIPTGVCGLDEPQEGAVAYIQNLQNIKGELPANLGALIAPADLKDKEIPFSGNILFAASPEWAFTQLLRAVDAPNHRAEPGIHPQAFVAANAKIGANVSVGPNASIMAGAEVGDGVTVYPNAYIGPNVKIGAGSVIYPNVTVRNGCILGRNVILQPGCVIGGDGFGYVFHNGKHEKIPQIGNVVIEDDVEIGANTTIDRAKINHTVIGANTKIDNLVQIGHNVRIGRATVVVSQAGIAGSAIIGNGVVIAGQAGLSGHLKVGDRAVIGPQAGIMSDVEPGAKVMGSPAMSYGDFMRSAAVLKKLPEVYKEFSALKKKAKKKLSIFSFFK